MDTNKNSYTFVFASAMIVVVALLLSGAALGLKDRQQKNISQEKKQNILRTIGMELTREEADAQFEDYVKQQLVIDAEGNELEGEAAFDINLATEIKMPIEEQRFPLYVAENNGSKYYIIPLRGAGLWNAIWGNICLEEDFSTVYGVTFDHQGETAGLGAEITQSFFTEPFKGKQIMEGEDFTSIVVQKGGAATLPAAQQVHAVDAISGGTLTSDGVTNMLQERLAHYLPYFEKQKQLSLN